MQLGDWRKGFVGRVWNTCRRCRDPLPSKTWVHIFGGKFSLFGDQIPYFYRNLIRVLERSIELDVNRPSQSVGRPVDVRVGVEHSVDVKENDAVEANMTVHIDHVEPVRHSPQAQHSLEQLRMWLLLHSIFDFWTLNKVKPIKPWLRELHEAADETFADSKIDCCMGSCWFKTLDI